MSLKLNKAVRVPVAVGVNVTLTAQVLEAAKAAPVQSSEVLLKSPGFTPLIVTAEILRLAVPALVIVSVWGGLVVFNAWLLKVSAAAEKLSAGPVPFPVRLTLCGLPPALSAKIREAL